MQPAEASTAPEHERPPRGAVAADALSAWWQRVVDHPVRVTFVLGLLVAAWNLLWIVRHRQPGGFDGDETGYLAMSLRFHRTLFDGGPAEMLRDVLGNYRVAPLVPLLSVPFAVVGGRGVGWLMVVQPAFHLLAAVAVSAIVTRLAPPRAALVAGVVALGLPVALINARSYHLAMAVTAFLCLATLAIVSCERGAHRGWMVAFGLAVGAMVTSRTASIAFVPGLAIATAVQVRWCRRTALNLGLALLAATVVAAPWWVTSWDSIRSYLFKFGYGTGATDLGPPSPWGRAAVRLGVLLLEVRPLLVLPGLLVLGAALVAAVQVWRTGDGWRNWPVLQRELVVVWLVVLVGAAALLTSSNIGTYLQTPVVVLAVAAVAGLGGRLGGRVVRWAGVAAVLVASCNVVLLSNWRVGSGVELPETSLSMMLFGGVETVQAINFADADPRFAPSSEPAQRVAAEREWARAATDVALALEELRPADGGMRRTFFGDIRLLEAGTLDAATELAGTGISAWEAPSARSAVGSGEVPLDPWTSDGPRVLVAVVPAARDPQEGLDPAPVLAEAAELGWRIRRSVALPDGGEVLLLTHPRSEGPPAADGAGQPGG